MFSGAVHAPCRILAVVGAEDTVEVGGMLLEGKGTVEELLGGHGEELGLVLRAIGVEEGFVTLLGEAAQPQEFAGSTRPPIRRTGRGRRGAGCRRRLRRACRACGRTRGKPRYDPARGGAPRGGRRPTPGSPDPGQRPGPGWEQGPLPGRPHARRPRG